MWWPLRRRGGPRGRVVFVGLSGDDRSAAPWDRADAQVLQVAWDALSSLGSGAPAGEAAKPDTAKTFELPPDHAPSPLDTRDPEVWLAFSDGSRLVLPPEDPATAALRSVADRMVARVDSVAGNRSATVLVGRSSRTGRGDGGAR